MTAVTTADPAMGTPHLGSHPNPGKAHLSQVSRGPSKQGNEHLDGLCASSGHHECGFSAPADVSAVFWG